MAFEKYAQGLAWLQARLRPCLLAATLTGAFPGSVQAASPHDHIVIVVLENHSADAGGEQRVWGNPAMPFLNSLADDPRHGARFASAWAAETPYRRVPAGFRSPLSARPSQPNYLYLFSGSHQGVLPAWFADPMSPYWGEALMAANGDRLPARLDNTRVGIGNRLVPAERRPFTTANLGASLLQKGKTFLSFSEGLPHPLWDGEGDALPFLDRYRRKHNPVINWVDLGPERTPRRVPENQRRFVLPAAVNLAFSSSVDPQGRRYRGFVEDEQGRPLGFERLPTVSLVVPDEQHDAHSASLADADAWLRQHIGPYAAWAREHNSLLIITFDEDGSTDSSQGDPYRTGRHTIATLFYGAGVKPGVYRERIDALNVLATVLHDQGLLDRFRADFLSTCPEDRATCEREHANLRPVTDVFGQGEPLQELPAE